MRQTRFVLPKNDDADAIRKFQFDFAKLMQDYQVDTIAIKERQQKGKFAGSPQGFKIEAALQLINDLRVVLLNPTAMKEQLKKNPLPIDFEDTGLKKFQETAFVTAYIELTHRTYNKV